MPDSDRDIWSTHSLLAQFRPEPEWQLDRACIGSYSADVRVVTAALMAFAGHATDPEVGSKVQFVQAFRKVASRVAIVVQRGRIHWPRNLPNVAGLLDRILFEANCDERELSWHPKFAVMRWSRREDDATSWRAWLGSRNLTRDLSRDAGLLLAECGNPAEGIALPGFRAAVEALQSRLPERASRFSKNELESLGRVRWQCPAGVNQMHVDWLDGAKDAFPTPEIGQSECIIISPFVDAPAIAATSSWTASGKKPIVVSSEAQLQAACARADRLHEAVALRTCPVGVEEGTPYEPLPQAEQDQQDSESELDRSDEVSAYHAKLIFMRKGRQKHLWLGSPNLTSRAWQRNFEIVAQLVSTAPRDPWTATLREIANHSVELESIQGGTETSLEDALEDAKKLICAELHCYQERIENRVRVVATNWPSRLAANLRLEVGCPWGGIEPVVWNWGQPVQELGEVPLEACTDLLLCRLSENAESTTWLMQAPYRPALDAQRDSAIIADYLGPAGYLALIGAELEGADGSGDRWDDEPVRRKRTSSKPSHYTLPTLEGLLRLFLRHPERLESVARTVRMMEQEASRWLNDVKLDAQDRAHLADFQKLWRDVGAFLTHKANGTPT